MEIEIFTLCDAAADYQARLSILGVFDTIFASQLPAKHPFCAVALRMRFAATEHGQHRLALHIVDHEGSTVIAELEAPFTVEMPDGSKIAAVNLVFNLSMLKFTRYGEHAVNLLIDGGQQASLPFWVKQPPARGEE